jgi:hypothetical protein
VALFFFKHHGLAIILLPMGQSFSVSHFLLKMYYIITKLRMQKPMMLKVEKLRRIQKSLAKHILQHLQAMGDLV